MPCKESGQFKNYPQTFFARKVIDSEIKGTKLSILLSMNTVREISTLPGSVTSFSVTNDRLLRLAANS